MNTQDIFCLQIVDNFIQSVEYKKLCDMKQVN